MGGKTFPLFAIGTFNLSASVAIFVIPLVYAINDIITEVFVKRAQILLKSDQRVNWTYDQISKAFDVSAVTIAQVRKTFVEQGMDETLQRKKPDREYEHVLDGEGEAHLIALACSEPPTGRNHWSLRLLQDRFVKLGHADSISYETIRRVLKKKNSSLD